MRLTLSIVCVLCLGSDLSGKELAEPGSERPAASQLGKDRPGLAAPSTPLAQYRLFDGETGASRDYWNRGAGLPWRNKCGDWRDAADQRQGRMAFAAAAPKADGRAEFDATALTKRWLAGSNTGALVRAVEGTCRLASRESGDPTVRPTITVVTDQGKCLCPCTADASLNPSTYRAMGSGATLDVSTRGATAVLQFDLSKIAGAVQSATLTVYAAPTDRCALELMRLDPPTIHTGGEARLGIAKGYPLDKGIASHPEVIFATDFASDDWRTRLFTEGRVSDPSFGHDETLKATYLRGQFVPGDVGSCSLDYRWTTHRQPEPEEVYFRYCVWLEDDFGSTVDGNKMPGLAGRYGIWNGRYWSVVCGNGGSRTTGLVSETARGKVRCGWSMRGVALRKPADDNPYKDLVAPVTYAYHADQAGHFGDDWRWGTVLLTKNRWYSIEQYAKMNSVSGPLDKLNNGKGQRDGVLRVWLDGVEVFEKTDIRYRHNTDIKIDEVWLNWYHGGTRPAAATHHYRMSNIVVARSYIGPVAIERR